MLIIFSRDPSRNTSPAICWQSGSSVYLITDLVTNDATGIISYIG